MIVCSIPCCWSDSVYRCVNKPNICAQASVGVTMQCYMKVQTNFCPVQRLWAFELKSKGVTWMYKPICATVQKLCNLRVLLMLLSVAVPKNQMCCIWVWVCGCYMNAASQCLAASTRTVFLLTCCLQTHSFKFPEDLPSVNSRSNFL